MIRPINAIRSTALAFVTAGALLAGCANNNNTKASTQNRTEVASKGVSDAIKANTINSPTYSKEHNKKLDNKYIKTFKDPNDIKSAKNDLADVYNNLGTFWASAEIQRSTDYEYLKLALSKFAAQFDDKRDYIVSFREEKAEKEKSEILDWYNNEYNESARIYEDNLASDKGVPSFEAVSASCDNFIKTLSFLSKEELESYITQVNNFKSEQKNPDSVQAKSDLIAFKVYVTDMIVLNNKFNEIDASNNGSCYNVDYYHIHRYLDKYMAKPAQPTP